MEEAVAAEDSERLLEIVGCQFHYPSEQKASNCSCHLKTRVVGFSFGGLHMSHSMKVGFRKGVVLVALAMLITSSFFYPVSTVSVPDGVDHKDEQKAQPVLVHIYYDGSSEQAQKMRVTTIAPLAKNGLFVESFDTSSISMLEYTVARLNPDYAIYYFESSMAGITIHGEEVTWMRVSDIVKDNLQTEHIFGIGNAVNLRDYVGDITNLHVDTSDVLDIRLGQLYSIWEVADSMSGSADTGWSQMGESLREDILRDFATNINEYFSKGLIPDDYTGERVPTPIDDPALTDSWIEEEKQFDEAGDELEPVLKAGSLAADDDYIVLREMFVSSGIGGPIGWLLDTLIAAMINLGFSDLALNVIAAEEVISHVNEVVAGIKDDVKQWFTDEGLTIADHDFNSHLSELLPRQMVQLWSLTDQLILDAWYDLDHYIGSFFNEIINTPVQTDLKGLVPVFLFRLGTPLNLGSSFARFGAVLRVKLLPDFEIDKQPFITFMNHEIMGESNLASISDTTTAFAEVRKFIDIIPVMDIDFAICAFLPVGNDWAQGLMAQFQVTFFGHAGMEIAFPPIDASNTPRAFIDVRSWIFEFELDASFSLSISAFLAPGPGGVISTILDWFSSLLSVSITLTLSIIFEISKKYQGQGLPALSTILFDIVIGVTLGIQILICVFQGTFKVGLRFEQQSGILDSGSLLTLAEESPALYYTIADLSTSTIGIYISLYASLYFGVDLLFVSFGTNLGGPWTAEIDISDTSGGGQYSQNAADLPDSDNDGLPDDFENAVSTSGFALADTSFYLNPNSADTDGDGLGDKLEIELNTQPNNADSDGDGLTDYEEHFTYLTDPLLVDTDRDNLTDYQEVIIYGTSPFVIDTDGDALYDWYEINTVYDVTYTKGTYGAVNSVTIGGMTYDDRTDPLNPDTDGDGLLDGAEGPNGVRYLNDSELAWYIYAHYPYTSPLDFDTDDDSVAWQFSGSWTDPFFPTGAFIWPLDDGTEVRGQIATIPDAEGFPEVKLVKTNPCYQDTDNDTAWGAVALFITDGYELARVPQWDPTNGDQDSDGLKDGYEVIGPGGTGTDAQNPDTDNDHLPDYEDYILATDPRNPDTDNDKVLDGDEYFIYGTNPLLNDTDYDGLTDGEELYYFYSNPLVRDSDVDGLTDGEEVLIYNTDPLVADSDHDLLTDGYEVFVSHTDPRLFDTDGDRLGDGVELLVYHSNPLDWDTDHDSLAYPNATGQMTLPLSDGAEVLDYGTSPISVDTDSDGLTDSQEIYLAQGYPGQAPILLDPLNNDTDSDGLLDGQELVLMNVSIITFPYQALMISYRFHSNPAMNDTDGDGLDDGFEVRYGTRPDKADTDSDMISDYNEIYVTHSNPLTNDTDGDEIPDNLESWEGIAANTTPPSATIPPFYLAAVNETIWPLYKTNISDPDTDHDYLPDGLELVYGTDPLNWDSNGNGIADGFEFDSDGDGLSDGEEFYIDNTWMTPLPIGNDSSGVWHWTGAPGGFLNPDSDGDGLNDGLEVKVYHTDPTSTDTDHDGVSDYDEVQVGSNPLVPITSGYPFWMIAAIIGGAGFIAGVIIPPVLRFTVGKVRGRRGRSASSKKKGPPKSEDAAASEKSETVEKSGKTTKRRSSKKKKSEEGDVK